VTRLVERSFPGVTSGWASANSPTRRSCSYVRPSKETTFPVLEKDRCSIPFVSVRNSGKCGKWQSSASRISWLIASKLGMGIKLNGQSKS